jgi:hypothetical protein
MLYFLIYLRKNETQKRIELELLLRGTCLAYARATPRSGKRKKEESCKVAQVVQCLLSKHEALSSNCSTTKKKKEKRMN